MFYEEPIPPENLDALADVRRQIDIPVATGERLYSKWDYRELLAKQAADIVQPDLVWVGGISEAKKVAAMAEASYLPVAPHNCQGPVAMAAAVQFGLLHAELPDPRVLRRAGGLARPVGHPAAADRGRLSACAQRARAGHWRAGRSGGSRPSWPASAAEPVAKQLAARSARPHCGR